MRRRASLAGHDVLAGPGSVSGGQGSARSLMFRGSGGPRSIAGRLYSHRSRIRTDSTLTGRSAIAAGPLRADPGRRAEHQLLSVERLGVRVRLDEAYGLQPGQWPMSSNPAESSDSTRRARRLVGIVGIVASVAAPAAAGQRCIRGAHAWAPSSGKAGGWRSRSWCSLVAWGRCGRAHRRGDGDLSRCFWSARGGRARLAPSLPAAGANMGLAAGRAAPSRATRGARTPRGRAAGSSSALNAVVPRAGLLGGAIGGFVAGATTPGQLSACWRYSTICLVAFCRLFGDRGLWMKNSVSPGAQPQPALVHVRRARTSGGRRATRSAPSSTEAWFQGVGDADEAPGRRKRGNGPGHVPVAAPSAEARVDAAFVPALRSFAHLALLAVAVLCHPPARHRAPRGAVLQPRTQLRSCLFAWLAKAGLGDRDDDRAGRPRRNGRSAG